MFSQGHISGTPLPIWVIGCGFLWINQSQWDHLSVHDPSTLQEESEENIPHFLKTMLDSTAFACFYQLQKHYEFFELGLPEYCKKNGIHQVAAPVRTGCYRCIWGFWKIWKLPVLKNTRSPGCDPVISARSRSTLTVRHPVILSTSTGGRKLHLYSESSCRK